MPPKRQSVDASTSDAKRKRRSRAAETVDARRTRLELERERKVRNRRTETQEQRDDRLERARARRVQRLRSETEEQTQVRLERDRERRVQNLISESEDCRRARLERELQRRNQNLVSETEDRRQARLESERIRRERNLVSESEEQRRDRLGMGRERMQSSRRSAHVELYQAAYHYRPDYDYNVHPAVDIGKMDKVCEFCNAVKFRNETPGLCCAGGKVKLPDLEPPPEPLAALTSGLSRESKRFLENIRKYNSCFQMTSFGATEIIRDNYMPTFKVQGQIYRLAGSLLPMPDSEPKFLQIYFMGGGDEEVNQRVRFNSNVDRRIMDRLQKFFHERNELVRGFKTALQHMPNDNFVAVIRDDRTPVGEHKRRFNVPTAAEIAAVVVGTECEARDIVIERQNGELQRVRETHRAYDALQYPMLFWKGEDGYHIDIKMRNPRTGEITNKNVSAMNFYGYRLMIRNNMENHILKCRQLFQQFVVDMYVKIETERLLYIRLNQKTLRSEQYMDLRDAIATDGNVNLNEVGKRVILPATFTGSPRHMHEYAQDAMTYVRVYGRPDLFITITCNPTWSEIKENLLPEQSSKDRPDIVARVFKQKLRVMMDFIVKHQVFGEVRCWMYSIEWQKRGLPHAHVLIWLVSKIVPDQIDDIISAEIPDASIDPDLFEVVTKNMIHGPCGTINIKSPCMKDGRCSKRYPRSLHPRTITGTDGYPSYRRRSIEDG